MKKLFFAVLLLPIFCISQTITSVSNGHFSNHNIWDCSCLPGSGDSVIIKHEVMLDMNVYFSSGQIWIEPSGVVYPNEIENSIWIDGSASLMNMGTFNPVRLRLSSDSYLENNLKMSVTDSIISDATLVNYGMITAREILNKREARMENNGSIDVMSNILNRGELENDGTIHVDGDFENCHGSLGYAELDNDGLLCIGNDLTNCTNDTIKGSGVCGVDGSFSNSGVLTGNLTVNTPNGTILGAGTIGQSVTVGIGECSLNMQEQNLLKIEVHPNPVETFLIVESNGLDYEICDMFGAELRTGVVEDYRIDMSMMRKGVYLLNISGTTIRVIKK